MMRSVQERSWGSFVLLSAVLIVMGAFAGVLLATIFPDLSLIWLLPNMIVVGCIVGWAVKKNASGFQ